MNLAGEVEWLRVMTMVPSTQRSAEFRTTHWSLVLEAGEVERPGSNQALEELCSIYWKPLYAFLRFRGYPPQDSEDLVQGLFHHLLHRREFFKKADENRGKFRSFLLGALKNFLSDLKAKESALKRGGGEKPLSFDVHEAEKWMGEQGEEDPTEEFDRRWAMTVLGQALARLEARSKARNQLEEYRSLFSYISGKSGATPPSALARELGVTEDAFKMKASRLRRALSRAIREVVAETVASPVDVDDELAYLKGLMKKTL